MAKNIYIVMFIIALFTVAKKWKQTGSLLITEWLKKVQ